MDWRKEWKALAVILAGGFACYFLPVENVRFTGALIEALHLVKWYAREHVLLCLVPAFFIAGAIGIFVSRASVMKYLGAGAHKATAYAVASVSGSILAVCSCTILPLFAGIYRMGAGIGPATAFLYSGPAINVLAIILTARVLGLELGIARAVGAVVFSVVIGLLMHAIYRNEPLAQRGGPADPPVEEPSRPIWQNALFFAAMIAILVFANWGAPGDGAAENADGSAAGLAALIWRIKWLLTSFFAIGLAVMLILWFNLSWWKVIAAGAAVVVVAVAVPGHPMIPFAMAVVGLSVITGTSGGEAGDWLASTWSFARQILPLLLAGVLVAGVLLGCTNHDGLIPSRWIASCVGGNSLWANLFASVAGALMYFATLTEVPILQGLLHAGMGKGPALALLLAGPALSLPNMLVIRSVLGTRKTLVYICLVVVMATASGLIFGALFGAPVAPVP